jgi:hypothetical protein
MDGRRRKKKARLRVITSKNALTALGKGWRRHIVNPYVHLFIIKTTSQQAFKTRGSDDSVFMIP